MSEVEGSWMGDWLTGVRVVNEAEVVVNLESLWSRNMVDALWPELSFSEGVGLSGGDWLVGWQTSRVNLKSNQRRKLT